MPTSQSKSTRMMFTTSNSSGRMDDSKVKQGDLESEKSNNKLFLRKSFPTPVALTEFSSFPDVEIESMMFR